MTNNDTKRKDDPSDLKTSALTLRAAKHGPSRGPRVLFIAASALGVAAMPGVADQLLSTLGPAIVGTASAAEPNECKAEEILPGYEQEVIKFLTEMGVKLPKGIEAHVSLFELSEAHKATIVRDHKIAILITSEGKVLPAPAGLYVFPDGIVAEIGKSGWINATWNQDNCVYGCDGDGPGSHGGGPWSMCRTPDDSWVDC